MKLFLIFRYFRENIDISIIGHIDRNIAISRTSINIKIRIDFEFENTIFALQNLTTTYLN